jgi:Ca-activated chloride channel family protein
MLPFSKTAPAILLVTLAALGICQEGGDRTFRADTRLVVLHASVVDKNGRLLTNLKEDSFKVFEDNVQQPLKNFRREDVPVSLGLIVDNSGSMRDKRKKVEAAALAMIKASNPQDEVTVVNFNDELYQDVLFTNDMRKLEEGIARLDSRGGTAMRDAISATIDYMKAKAKHDKKVIVIITDGDDNASAMTLEKLIGKAQQTEILCYSVGLLSEEEKREARRAKRALEALAEATGAASIFPKETADVEQATLQFAHEIRNQYMLAYTPTNPTLDGTFRKIRIAVNGPGKPVARTRTGYYATPEAKKSAQVTQSSSSR